MENKHFETVLRLERKIGEFESIVEIIGKEKTFTAEEILKMLKKIAGDEQ